MAKKAAKPAEPTPEAKPGPRKTVLTIKGTDAWSEWLQRLGKHMRTPTSTIVDHALVRYARENGFDEPAPER